MRPAVLAMALAFLLGGTSGSAHHSYADFYDHAVSVEGTLEKVVFANPHTILTVRTEDAVYTGNWRAAFQLNTMGVRRPTDAWSWRRDRGFDGSYVTRAASR